MVIIIIIIIIIIMYSPMVLFVHYGCVDYVDIFMRLLEENVVDLEAEELLPWR